MQAILRIRVCNDLKVVQNEGLMVEFKVDSKKLYGIQMVLSQGLMHYQAVN